MDQELQLRDIHLPDAIGWWPLAPGWWLAALFVFLSLGLLIWLKRRRKSAKSIALRELESIVLEKTDAKQKLQKASILLKRAFISVYREEDVAGLTGAAWLEFMDKQMGDKRFSQGPGRLLSETLYRQNTDADLNDFLALCRECLKRLPRK